MGSDKKAFCASLTSQLAEIAQLSRMQLSSNAAIAKHTTQATFTNPFVATPRHSATLWYVLIQLSNIIDTLSKTMEE